MTYRADIDGLRAIAVLTVVFFHAGLACPGGYVGVDVFFVISGYLITALVLKDFQTGDFSLVEFWERRVRRILPALAAMLILVGAFGVFVLLPTDMEDLGESIVAQLLLVANVHFWRDAGYFAGPSELKPLLHTWSLAVEEQFYLLYPIVLILLLRRGRRTTAWVLGIVLLASFGASIYGVRHHPSATFFLLPTRAWELLVGCGIALIPSEVKAGPTVARLLAFGGLATIAIAALLYDRNTAFPGVAALLPVGGAAALIYGNGSHMTLVGRLLSWTPLTFIGRISYSLYLLHWPMFAYARYVLDRAPPIQISLLLIGASIAAAAVSWAMIENPVRRRSVFINRRQLAAGAAGYLLVVSAFCLVTAASAGFAGRMPAAMSAAVVDHELGANLEQYRSGTPPMIGAAATSQSPSFIIWGDSHAGVLLPVFDAIARERGVYGYSAADGGCPPIPGVGISWNKDLPEWNSLVLKTIREQRIRHVFLVARWANYVEGATEYDQSMGNFATAPLLYPENEQTECSREAALKCFANGLNELVNLLQKDGCVIYIVRQCPEQPFDPFRRCFVYGRLGCDSASEVGVSVNEYENRQTRVAEVFADLERQGVVFIDGISSMFDSTGHTVLVRGEVPLYRDSQHLSTAGASQFIGPAISQCLDIVAARGESAEQVSGVRPN